jgi:hypothetical protein
LPSASPPPLAISSGNPLLLASVQVVIFFATDRLDGISIDEPTGWTV